MARESIKTKKTMKKTYIKPESVVVAINAKSHLMDASNPTINPTVNAQKFVPEDAPQANGGDTFGRDVISTPDAWEEW